MLPSWPLGTVAVLVTAGGPPHAIPVSALVRPDPGRVLIGLPAGRESLGRLRRDPAVALVVLDQDLAITIHGRARVADESLVEGVVAVEILADSVQDHLRPTFELRAGVDWQWTDERARDRDAAVREALSALAAEPAPGDPETMGDD